MNTNRISLFPTQWLQLIEKVPMSGEPTHIKGLEKTTAHRLRWRFYRLRKLLLASQASEQEVRLAKLAEQIQVLLSEDQKTRTWTLSFVFRDANDEARMLEEALQGE